MGKYADLIDSLVGSTRKQAREALIRADGRALRPLARALREHPNEDVREEIAEILGERRHWKAIPPLIEALSDENLFVRQDAQWSIESICRLQPKALVEWLETFPEDDDFRDKVLEWWNLNRRFIEGNEELLY